MLSRDRYGREGSRSADIGDGRARVSEPRGPRAGYRAMSQNEDATPTILSPAIKPAAAAIAAAVASRHFEALSPALHASITVFSITHSIRFGSKGRSLWDFTHRFAPLTPNLSPG